MPGRIPWWRCFLCQGADVAVSNKDGRSRQFGQRNSIVVWQRVTKLGSGNCDLYLPQPIRYHILCSPTRVMPQFLIVIRDSAWKTGSYFYTLPKARWKPPWSRGQGCRSSFINPKDSDEQEQFIWLLFSGSTLVGKSSGREDKTYILPSPQIQICLTRS